jgi:hypothetical protein
MPRASNEPALDVDEYLDLVSDTLDNVLYQPLYAMTVKGEGSCSEQMAKIGSIKQVNIKLKTIKATALVFGIVMLLAAVYNMKTRNLIRATLYGIVALDALRVSFNCYIKSYCHIIAEKYSGDWKKLGNTILKAAQSALGLGGKNANDPLVRMQKDVMWDVLIDKLLIIAIYEKVSMNLFMYVCVYFSIDYSKTNICSLSQHAHAGAGIYQAAAAEEVILRDGSFASPESVECKIIPHHICSLCTSASADSLYIGLPRFGDDLRASKFVFINFTSPP